MNYQKLRKENEFMFDFLYFVIILAVAGILLNAFMDARPNMVAERVLVAQHTAFGLQLFGVDAQTHDWSVIVTEADSATLLEVQIIPECVGWMGIFAVAALIFAYPRVPWRKRSLGLLITLPTMYIINILRLVTSVYSAHIGGIHTFEFTHNTLWKTTLILCALGLWIVWIYFIVEENTLSNLKRDVINFFERRPKKQKKIKKRKHAK